LCVLAGPMGWFWVSEGCLSAPTMDDGAKWHELARPPGQGRLWWCGEGCLVMRSQAAEQVFLGPVWFSGLLEGFLSEPTWPNGDKNAREKSSGQVFPVEQAIGTMVSLFLYGCFLWLFSHTFSLQPQISPWSQFPLSHTKRWMLLVQIRLSLSLIFPVVGYFSQNKYHTQHGPWHEGKNKAEASSSWLSTTNPRTKLVPPQHA